MCLTLALLAGFAARDVARPRLAHAATPARGPLIEAADHPEWRQFLVHAAFRRADEIERLRALPDTPMIVEPLPASEPAPADDTGDKVAALPPQHSPEQQEDITGSIDDKPTGSITVEIGESSSVELPLSDREILPPVREPESLQQLNDVQPQAPRQRIVRIKKKPPAKPAAQPAVPDLLTLFGERASQPQ